MAINTDFDFGGGPQPAHLSLKAVSQDLRRGRVTVQFEIYSSAAKRAARKAADAELQQLAAQVLAKTKQIDEFERAFAAKPEDKRLAERAKFDEALAKLNAESESLKATQAQQFRLFSENAPSRNGEEREISPVVSRDGSISRAALYDALVAEHFPGATKD